MPNKARQKHKKYERIEVINFSSLFFFMQPTLIQVFGANATQTSTDLIIKKADLVDVGLTTSATNEAEKLLVAVIKLAAIFLSQNKRDGSTTPTVTANPEQNIAIVLDSIPQFPSRDDGTGNFIVYERKTYSVQMDRLYIDTEIDPDNY
jgi:hypothetical protein